MKTDSQCDSAKCGKVAHPEAYLGPVMKMPGLSRGFRPRDGSKFQAPFNGRGTAEYELLILFEVV